MSYAAAQTSPVSKVIIDMTFYRVGGTWQLHGGPATHQVAWPLPSNRASALHRARTIAQENATYYRAKVRVFESTGPGAPPGELLFAVQPSSVVAKPFSGPEDCSSSEHWDAENERCAPGLCPPGLVIGSSGNCVEPGAEPAPASSSDGGSLWGSGTPSSSGGGGRPPPPPDGPPDQASMGSSPALLLAGVVGVGLIGYWFFKRAG